MAHLRPCASVALAWLCLGCASEPPAAPRPAPVRISDPIGRMRTEIAARVAQSSPGEPHRRLDFLVGDWRTEQVADPEGTPTLLTTGSARAKWMHEGRYLRFDSRVEVGGAAFDATTIFGYDKERREYQSLTITDLGTGMEVSHGGGDPERGGIRLELDLLDTESGSQLIQRTRLLKVSADEFSLDSLRPDPRGGEIVVQRTRYTRIKR